MRPEDAPGPARAPRRGLAARLLHLVRSRPRLWTSAAVGVAVGLLASAWRGHPADAPALLGWNAFVAVYLLLAWQLTRGASHAQLRERAHSQHEGRHGVLALGLAAVAWSLLAIASQLSAIKAAPAGARGGPLALVVLTVAASWLFTQVLFALHYAHGFYVARSQQGQDPMQFPGTDNPDYGDFLYAACVIGTSGQPADVAFTDSSARRVATLHCVQAFVFNTTTLALGVNIAASLF